MLTYYANDYGYRITETIKGFTSDTIRHVDYTKDLMQYRVNESLWQETTENGREWFRKHYLPKF